jgi:hypothetical protein
MIRYHVRGQDIFTGGIEMAIFAALSLSDNWLLWITLAVLLVLFTLVGSKTGADGVELNPKYSSYRNPVIAFELNARAAPDMFRNVQELGRVKSEAARGSFVGLPFHLHLSGGHRYSVLYRREVPGCPWNCRVQVWPGDHVCAVSRGGPGRN